MTPYRRPLALGTSPPIERRGILPLIMAALAVGKAAYGAIQANQTKQRNKGYINDAYRTAGARMTQQQQAGAEGNLESLNARGMATGGISPIRAALTSGQSGATTLGQQSQSELGREYTLDRHSLDAAHTQALNENKADALNAQIGAISGGIQGVAGAVSAGSDLSQINAMNGASSGGSPIRSALLSGSSFDGVHPTDPLNDPTSSWHTPAHLSINGDGFSNSEFNA